MTSALFVCVCVFVALVLLSVIVVMLHAHAFLQGQKNGMLARIMTTNAIYQKVNEVYVH